LACIITERAAASLGNFPDLAVERRACFCTGERLADFFFLGLAMARDCTPGLEEYEIRLPWPFLIAYPVQPNPRPERGFSILPVCSAGRQILVIYVNFNLPAATQKPCNCINLNH
jgi:hypothetical protein